MKTKLCVLFFLLAAALAQSQTNNLTSLLQQGLLEEQANRNLDAAIADYQSLATKFDKDRQIAVTAIFRLGECYRAQGKTNEAAVQYQRILHDFSDQATLATLSRQNLAGMGAAKTETTAVENPTVQLWKKIKDLPEAELEKILPTLVADSVLSDLLQKRNEAQQKRASLVVDYATNNPAVERVDVIVVEFNRQIAEKVSGIMQGLKLQAEALSATQPSGDARQQQKELLAKQIALAEQDLAETQKLVQVGKAVAADTRAAEREVLRLRQQLAALDSGRRAELLDLSVPVKSEEDQEIERIEKLLQTSPDLINKADNSGNTLLSKATVQGQTKVVNYLLDHGADVNAGFPALYQAAGAGNRAMVELLLNRGANVNLDAEYGRTALTKAATEGFVSIVELLLANKADPKAADTRNGQTPLWLAVYNGHDKCVKLLLAAGAGVDAETTDNPQFSSSPGRTSLSIATERQSLEMLKTLLAAKADPNAGKKNPPLLCAIAVKNIEAAEILLRAGANPNAAGTGSFNDMHFEKNADFLNHHWHMTPLWLAIYLNQPAMVQLLLKFKANPNDVQTDGQALLFSALDKPEIAGALLDAGANTEATKIVSLNRMAGPRPLPSYHLTLLQEAASRNQAETVKLLLQHGTQPDVCEERGNSSLHYAAFSLADEQVFASLFNHKVNPNARNEDGMTPLDIVKQHLQDDNNWPARFENLAAKKAQSEKLIALLHQHGALDNLPDWGRITVSRPSANFSATVFQRGTNDWNRFTLLELIFRMYPNGTGSMFSHDAMPFPDLTRIVVVRPSANGAAAKRIEVNLLNATNGVDCSRDVPLEFGDVVEIPEREHSLAEKTSFLSWDQVMTILTQLRVRSGEARLVVADRSAVQVTLQPGFLDVGNVLHYQNIRETLTSSSDLSRVKITRRDPKTNTTKAWILDCSNKNNQVTPDLWLRNGDVIEVPEKP